jgi:hypothetical protein
MVKGRVDGDERIELMAVVVECGSFDNLVAKAFALKTPPALAVSPDSSASLL